MLNQAAGTYYVKAIDANSCVSSDFIILTEPSALSVVPSVLQELKCNGDSDGILSANGTNGTPIYSYKWFSDSLITSISNNQVVTGLSSDTFYVQITDMSLCVADTFIVLTEPSSLSLNTNITKEIYCSGDTTGEIKAYADLSNPPYSFLWSSNNLYLDTLSQTSDLLNVYAGRYYARITDVNSCVDTISQQINNPVNESVSFVLNPIYNVTDTAQSLIGTPVGGNFEGNGVSAFDNTFYPNIVGENPSVVVSYTYVDSFHCEITIYDTTKVVKAGGRIEDFLPIYCYSDSNYLITGIPDTLNVSIDSIDVSYFDTTVFSGLHNLGNNIASFNPKDAGPGTYDLIFIYILKDATRFSVTESVIVDSIGSNLDFLGNYKYCISDIKDTLKAVDVYPSGGKFLWSIPDTTLGYTVNNNTYILSPSEIGIIDTTIKFTYTSENNCSASVSHLLTIYGLPSDFLNIENEYCANNSSVKLVENDTAHYIYNITGNGIVNYGDSIVFYPSDISAGVHNITYEYKDNHNCTNITVQNCDILPIPILNISSNDSYCRTNDTIIISGKPISIYGNPIDTVEEGYFTGVGVIDDNADGGDGFAQFIPKYIGGDTLADIINTISYIYTDTNNCTAFLDKEISIFALPVVNFSIDSAYCAYDTIHLHSIYSSNYSFTSPNLQSDTIVLLDSTLVGVLPISYSYINQHSCVNTIAKTTIIDSIPNEDFYFENQYCANSNDITLHGNDSSQFHFSFSGEGVDNNIFRPSNVGVGNHVITYQYIDTVSGCFSQTSKTYIVQPIPILSILSEDSYCRTNTQDSVYGKPAYLYGNEVVGDINSGWFNATNIVDLDSSGAAYFIPKFIGNDTLIDEIYTINYTFTDTNNCTSTIDKEIMIYALPTVNFSFETISNFCNHDTIKLINPFVNQDGTFSLNPNIFIIDTNNSFVPNSTISNLEANYIYTDANNCTNDISKFVTINPVPKVHFVVGGNNECASDSILLIDNTVIDEEVKFWKWKFYESDTSYIDSTTFNQTYHTFDTSGTHKVELYVETMSGCPSSLDTSITLGEIPIVDFYWENECVCDSIHFIDMSYSDSSTINRWEWDFGNNSTLQNSNPFMKYYEPNVYNVDLKVFTNYGCTNSISKTIYVRPYINNDLNTRSSLYSEDFNDNNYTGWKSYDVGTWKRDFSDTSSNNGIIKTIDKSSVILSPYFDFSKLDKPMIKLNLKYNLIYNSIYSDGVVLQATTDTVLWGKTDSLGNKLNVAEWTTIGNSGDVINWYNSSSINSNPGGQSNGWADTLSSLWFEARHNLDDFAKSPHVVFRFVLGAYEETVLSQNYSFAFDNVWIGNRTQKSLLENFIEYKDTASYNTMQRVLDVALENKENDIIDIYYHTESSNNDFMNADNTVVSRARAFYYGLSLGSDGYSLPYFVLDGNGLQNELYPISENFKTEKMDECVLGDPKFKIDTFHFEGLPNSISFSTTITALEDLESQSISVFSILIEQNIDTLIPTKFKNVVKQIYPNFSGIEYTRSWNINDTERIEITQDIDFNIYNQDTLAVVVFVQNNLTKEIYQVETSANYSISTGLKKILTEYIKNGFVVYPNPANNSTNVFMKNTINDTYKIQLFNSFGILISEKQYDFRNNSASINLKGLNSGVYFVRVFESGKVLGTNKIIVR